MALPSQGSPPVATSFSGPQFPLPVVESSLADIEAHYASEGRLLMSMGDDTTSAVANKIDASHISAIIQNDESKSRRDHEYRKLLTYVGGSVIVLVFLLVILYVWLFQSATSQLPRDVGLALLTGLGGGGIGYGVGFRKRLKQSEDDE